MDLHALYAIILDRRANPKHGSYTCELFARGEDEVLKKVGEEAIEVILAAKGQGNHRLVEETADLLYHLLVLLVERGVTLSEVEAELERRHQSRGK